MLYPAELQGRAPKLATANRLHNPSVPNYLAFDVRFEGLSAGRVPENQRGDSGEQRELVVAAARFDSDAKAGAKSGSQ